MDAETFFTSEKNIYEARDIDTDGRTLIIKILEYATDAEAIAWAQGRANEYQCLVSIHQTPFVNTSSQSSFDIWPDMRIVATVEPQQ